MWQCSFCKYTSHKKWNVQLHEKQKHSTLNLNNQIQNNQIDNEEIKIEEETIHCSFENKKPIPTIKII